MAIKPTDGHLEWITDDDAAKYIAPSAGKRLSGWLKEEKPPFQYFNWAFRLVDRWLKYFEAATDDILGKVGIYEQSATLDNDTQYTFTGLVPGKRYRLEFEIVLTEPSAASQLLYMRLGNSGGIDAGNNYDYQGYFGFNGDDESAGYISAQNRVPIATGGEVLLGGTIFTFGEIEFSTMPGDGTLVQGHSGGQMKRISTTAITHLRSFFQYDGASDIDRIQVFVLGSVVISSGRLRLRSIN